MVKPLLPYSLHFSGGVERFAGSISDALTQGTQSPQDFLLTDWRAFQPLEILKIGVAHHCGLRLSPKL
jgi:hypothetical protein